jgi:hypothetical protein
MEQMDPILIIVFRFIKSERIPVGISKIKVEILITEKTSIPAVYDPDIRLK